MTKDKQYAELLIAMATDFLMGGISFKTLKSNLKIMLEKIDKEVEL